LRVRCVLIYTGSDSKTKPITVVIGCMAP